MSEKVPKAKWDRDEQGPTEAAILVSWDQSNSPVLEPDFNGMAVNVLARLDQGRIVILACDDLRRAVHAAILVELVEAVT
jgi:hypothetical protein